MMTEIKMLRIAAIFAAILLGMTLTGYAHCQTTDRELSFTFDDTPENYTAKVEHFLHKFFAKCSPKKLKNALEIVPILVDTCKEKGVNPSLVASIVSYESTWRIESVGKLGEVGLMQVQGSTAKTPREQLSEGLDRLLHSYKKCGTTLGAVSYYGTGHTCKPYRGAELRIKTALKIEDM